MYTAVAAGKGIMVALKKQEVLVISEYFNHESEKPREKGDRLMSLFTSRIATLQGLRFVQHFLPFRGWDGQSPFMCEFFVCLINNSGRTSLLWLDNDSSGDFMFYHAVYE